LRDHAVLVPHDPREDFLPAADLVDEVASHFLADGKHLVPRGLQLSQRGRSFIRQGSTPSASRSVYAGAKGVRGEAVWRTHHSFRRVPRFGAWVREVVSSDCTG